MKENSEEDQEQQANKGLKFSRSELKEENFNRSEANKVNKKYS